MNYNLDTDTIYYISFYLKFEDILIFSIICKELYYIFDDLYYKNLATKLYGRYFWFKDLYINPDISNKYKLFKSEIIRIENFKKKINKLNIPLRKRFL